MGVELNKVKTMKRKEEIAREGAWEKNVNRVPKGSPQPKADADFSEYIENALERGFIAGIEHATRWRTLAEEFPDHGDTILVKYYDGSIGVIKMHPINKYFVASNVAEWRPINF